MTRTASAATAVAWLQDVLDDHAEGAYSGQFTYEDQVQARALQAELERLRAVEAAARNLREPYQPGGVSAEFAVLQRLLGRTP